MEMMDPGNMQTEMPKDMQAMMEGMEKLQEIIDAQKNVRDQVQELTQQAGVEQSYSEAIPNDSETMKKLGLSDMPPPPQATRKPGDTSAPAQNYAGQMAAQQAIRKTLGDFTLEMEEKLGKTAPENLGKADQAMSQALDTLSQNDPAATLPHQEEALRHLNDSQQQMSQQLANRMKEMMMMSFGTGPTDPLGRPMSEGNDGTPWSASKVKIPDEAERRKIHGILEGLRKKSGELQRPAYELDYYRRLMRQF